MELKWIRVEDEMPVDNGRIQKFLVRTNFKTSVFPNGDITTCYFTDRFRKESSGISKSTKITHWARIEEPEDLDKNKLKFSNVIVKEIEERGPIEVPDGYITGEEFEKYLRKKNTKGE